MLLSASHVAKKYGADVILTDVTFRLDAREKVALVGRNGTGKTTLLKLIIGSENPDSGSIQTQKGAKVGYLRQEVQVDTGRTVLEEAQEGMRAQLQMRDRLEVLENRMLNEPTNDELDEYSLLHEHFLDAQGYSADRDIRTVLNKMGFSDDEFSKQTSRLSGGEKTRLAIARLLLEEPDILILDEPTNHLDLQATEWLERWLVQYHGAVILVSHDRAFLDSTAERVIEMRDGTVTSWPGPFPKYLQLRAEAEERQAVVARRQDLEIAKMDEYVRRFMNSQRTAQARGRLKLMNRMIESKVQAPKNDKGMTAGFKDSKRSGDLVVEAKKLNVGFPSEDGPVVLFKDLDWTVKYGDRWGIIGENGAGKSTLVKVMLDLIEPLSGTIRLGAGVVAGYFSQDAANFDQDMTPLDLMVYDCDMTPQEARTLMGRFLIEGDDVYRPIKTLSGGEKNKLSLARLTVLNPNLLVLDEPTNHLDMASREALADVLKDYAGTLILVSHDRWLLGKITQLTLDVRKAGPIVYPGGYEDYRRGKAVPAPALITKAVVKPAEKEEPAEPEMSPRELSKEIQRLVKLVFDFENRISDQEDELRLIEADLANLAPTADVFQMTKTHQRVQEQLQGSMSAWEEHSARLEKLQALQRG